MKFENVDWEHSDDSHAKRRTTTCNCPMSNYTCYLKYVVICSFYMTNIILFIKQQHYLCCATVCL